MISLFYNIFPFAMYTVKVYFHIPLIKNSLGLLYQVSYQTRQSSKHILHLISVD